MSSSRHNIASSACTACGYVIRLRRVYEQGRSHLRGVRRDRIQRSTSWAKRGSSSLWGWSVSPVWTGRGGTIVLEGATSQWKRSDGGSFAIGPPCGSPAAIRSTCCRCGRTSAGSHLGESAARSCSSSCVRAPRKRRGRQKSTTPALTASPRSTCGTIRSAAYWNGLRAAGTLGFLHPLARALEPPRQELRVLAAVAPVGRE